MKVCFKKWLQLLEPACSKASGTLQELGENFLSLMVKEASSMQRGEGNEIFQPLEKFMGVEIYKIEVT